MIIIFIQCFCLILVMKYSRKMLDDKMSERTKEIFEIQYLLKQSISIQRVRVRKINRAVKIRIYPNKEQITQIEKTIGCSRFLYNRMLADKIRHYQEEKKMLKNTPAGYKKEYPWLKEVDSLALANVHSLIAYFDRPNFKSILFFFSIIIYLLYQNKCFCDFL